MKKMPENFTNSKTFPFKISVTKEKDKYYATVEKLSILYDFYNDQEIPILNIGTPLILKSDSANIITLTTTFTQKGNLITSARIDAKDEVPQNDYDADYYPIKIYTVLGYINNINIINDSYDISQYIRSNLTKFTCVDSLGEL